MMRSLGWKFLMMGVLVFMLGAPLIAISSKRIRRCDADASIPPCSCGQAGAIHPRS